ncbi:MAG: hypothetical protein ACRDTR_00875 [Rubrobacter sp.]
MNSVHIEQSLAQMHREDIAREVSANRSERQLRAHRGGGTSVWRLPGLSLLGLGRTIPERAASS